MVVFSNKNAAHGRGGLVKRPSSERDERIASDKQVQTLLQRSNRESSEQSRLEKDLAQCWEVAKLRVNSRLEMVSMKNECEVLGIEKEMRSLLLEISCHTIRAGKATLGAS